MMAWLTNIKKIVDIAAQGLRKAVVKGFDGDEWVWTWHDDFKVSPDDSLMAVEAELRVHPDNLHEEVEIQVSTHVWQQDRPENSWTRLCWTDHWRWDGLSKDQQDLAQTLFSQLDQAFTVAVTSASLLPRFAAQRELLRNQTKEQLRNQGIYDRVPKDNP